MGSRPSFFRRGLTKARFQRRGKQPDSSGRLINLVFGVSNTSRHSVKSLVGIRSREQVVFVDDLISSRTSVSDRGRNSEKEKEGA